MLVHNPVGDIRLHKTRRMIYVHLCINSCERAKIQIALVLHERDYLRLECALELYLKFINVRNGDELS